MKLSELLKNVEVLNILGNEDIEISGVNIDSRRIEAGHLFVAIPGTQTDGHKFIPKAIEQGAVAVLCEYFPNKREPGITYIAVESTEDCVGEVATQFYGEPSKKLKLVGVTGTNGKSSDISAVCSLRSATILKTKLYLLTTRHPTLLN